MTFLKKIKLIFNNNNKILISASVICKGGNSGDELPETQFGSEDLVGSSGQNVDQQQASTAETQKIESDNAMDFSDATQITQEDQALNDTSLNSITASSQSVDNHSAMASGGDDEATQITQMSVSLMENQNVNQQSIFNQEQETQIFNAEERTLEEAALLMTSLNGSMMSHTSSLEPNMTSNPASADLTVQVKEESKPQQSYEEMLSMQRRNAVDNADIFKMLDGCSDPLSTLASAAVSSARSSQNINLSDNTLTFVPTKVENNNAAAGQQFNNNNQQVGSVYPTLRTLPLSLEVEDDKKEGWADVVHTKYNVIQVKQYFNVNEKLSNLPADTDVCRDLEFIKKRLELQPGTAYKFRVAALNACGRGPWSEVETKLNFYSPHFFTK